MNYKGFKGSINFCKIDNVFFGKMENTDHLICYEGKNLGALYNDFKFAVDDHLNFIIHNLVNE